MPEDSIEYVVETIEVSEEEIVIDGIDGLEITIPPFIVDEEVDLSMGVVDEDNLDDELIEGLPEDQSILKVFDLTLGDQEAFNDFIEVKVPHEELGIDYEDALDTVMVYTYDEDLEELIPEMVDIDDEYVIFYVNHFSKKVFVEDTSGTSIAAKVRKSDMMNVSREEVEAILDEIQGGADEDASMAKLGFKALDAGTSWSGNLTTFTSLAEHSGSMKSVYGNLTILGNTLFYVKCAEAVNDGIEKGSYGKLAKVILTDGVGYVIGNFAAAPIKVAYTGGAMIMKYVGDTTMEFVKSEHDEKFYAVMPKLVTQYMEDQAAGIKGVNNPKIYHYKKALRDQLIEVARESGDPDAVKEALDEMVDKIADELLLGDTYGTIYDEMVVDYAGSQSNEEKSNFELAWDKIRNTDVERVPDDLKKRMVGLLMLEMKPVLGSLARTMQTEAEQAYYRSFIKVAKQMQVEYQIDFLMDSDVPEDMTAMVLELYDANQGKTLYETEMDGFKTTLYMSYETFSVMGSPTAARLAILTESGEPAIYQVSYQFKLEDHEVVFDIDGDGIDVITDDVIVDGDIEDNEDSEDIDGDEDETPNFDLSGGIGQLSKEAYGHYEAH